MWIVRWILGAIIILAVLGFALQNQNTSASVTIINWTSPQIPLYILLYISFGIGLLFWALVSIFNILKQKGNILKLQRENRKLREEISRLRNIDIDELVSEESAAKEEELPAEPAAEQ